MSFPRSSPFMPQTLPEHSSNNHRDKTNQTHQTKTTETPKTNTTRITKQRHNGRSRLFLWRKSVWVAILTMSLSQILAQKLGLKTTSTSFPLLSPWKIHAWTTMIQLSPRRPAQYHDFSSVYNHRFFSSNLRHFNPATTTTRKFGGTTTEITSSSSTSLQCSSLSSSNTEDTAGLNQQDKEEDHVSTSWKINTVPFSKYATHVQIIGSCENNHGHYQDNNTDNQNIENNKNNYDDDKENNGVVEASVVTSSLSVVEAIEYVIRQQQEQQATSKSSRRRRDPPWLSPFELLQMGAIWYLSADEYSQQQRQSDSKGGHGRNGNWNLKPRRLTEEHFHSTLELQPGDYLRVHHTPRRFETVHDYQWNQPIGTTTATTITSSPSSLSNIKQGLVVAQNTTSKGFLVINKPPLVPVHATVDNGIENVVYQIQNATPGHPLDYVSTTHRVDINTSGLLVVATTKSFAAYFATLLRRKTRQQLQLQQPQKTLINNNNSNSSNIFKGYKCLVCVIEPLQQQQQQQQQSEHDEDSSHNLSSMSVSPWSVEHAVAKLQDYVDHQTVIRHYLEPSARAPKRFEWNPPPPSSSTTLPDNMAVTDDHNATVDPKSNNNNNSQKDWLECLLQIRAIRGIYPVERTGVLKEDEDRASWGDHVPCNNDDDRQRRQDLLQSLWPSPRISQPPSQLRAVVELEVHLITGRTHQIRGQLSRLGYPLVGDEHYGGARSISDEEEQGDESNSHPTVEEDEEGQNHKDPLMMQPPQLLALQCCELAFWDPDYVEEKSSPRRRKGQHQNNNYSNNVRNNKEHRTINVGEEVSLDEKDATLFKGVISDRWNHFRLEDSAWWSPLLTKYRSVLNS